MKDFEERKVNDEDEIDLIALVQKLWAGRKTVIKYDCTDFGRKIRGR